MDMLDYINWRGDLTFEEREINEIDGLIFANLSYENFSGILDKHSTLTINQLAELFFKQYNEEDLKNRKTFTFRSYELLKIMAYTPRYGSIIVSNYIDELDQESNLQFCAITFAYKNKWKYIAFRGTDESIIGWKEDFMMLYEDEIPSQKKAVEYLTHLLKQHRFFSKTKYYIGGHSKGGNLAIYASAFVSSKHILAIHNFDGPGFDTNFWLKPKAQNILPKITTYIPSASFFGRLFKHHEKTMIIKSDERGIMQHNAFFWYVDVDKFLYEQKVTDGSKKALLRFNDLMNNYTKKEREKLVTTLFSIFENLNINTIEDMTKISIHRVISSVKELNDLDSPSKKAIRELLTIIWEISND